MDYDLERSLREAASAPPDTTAALLLAEQATVPALCEAARARRDGAFGNTLGFSPKVFLPLTNLCRNYCDYCSFRRSPNDAGAWTMSRKELDESLSRARECGASEALFCLGDRPETVFPSYRRTLASLGHESTVDYLFEACERALAKGLLPHSNAGLLSLAELTRLRKVNVSMGLMLESASARLCERGMPHHRAPDKLPARRLAMMRDAGALSIPLTTGILLGIGETARERTESLLAIRALHEEHGHIQEVIVQSFRAHPATAMEGATEIEPSALLRTIALARLILPDDVSVQAPPNLTRGSVAPLLAAGINDFGGISAVTPDYINPRHPWPHIAELAAECASHGFALSPRLPVYDRFAQDPRFIDQSLTASIAATRARLARVTLSATQVSTVVA